MSDETDPLSVCCKHLANLQHIIEAKNAEIARLRLTDEEREAVEWSEEVAKSYGRVGHRQAGEVAATFRSLLERLV